MEKYLWNMSDECGEYPEFDDVSCNVPEWIEPDISPYTIISICQGGCASGAYMPAVTYQTALEVMSEHGDSVLDYICDSYGELPKPKDTESWSGMAVFYLSCAVELWAQRARDEMLDAMQEHVDQREKELREEFNESIKPLVIEQYGEDDQVAMNEEWNNWTDSLCSDGQIYEYVCNNVTLD